MDDNDFSQNRYAVYPKFTPREFKEFKQGPHFLEGIRFAKGGRMQDPLMANKPNQKQELVIVENSVMNEPETAAAETVTTKKAKKYRGKPLWPEIVNLLRQHPDGLDRDTIARKLGETSKAIASALGSARAKEPEVLSTIDGRWVLKRIPEGMQDDSWEVSRAVGRIFTPPEPALPEFDQAAEFVAAVREIARRVMATDERLALLLQMGAEFVEQVTQPPRPGRGKGGLTAAAGGK